MRHANRPVNPLSASRQNDFSYGRLRRSPGAGSSVHRDMMMNLDDDNDDWCEGPETTIAWMGSTRSAAAKLL